MIIYVHVLFYYIVVFFYALLIYSVLEIKVERTFKHKTLTETTNGSHLTYYNILLSCFAHYKEATRFAKPSNDCFFIDF